jgi:hypothetical protein
MYVQMGYFSNSINSKNLILFFISRYKLFDHLVLIHCFWWIIEYIGTYVIGIEAYLVDLSFESI